MFQNYVWPALFCPENRSLTLLFDERGFSVDKASGGLGRLSGGTCLIVQKTASAAYHLCIVKQKQTHS